MVLDEDALEAMLARGRRDADQDEPADMVTTDETDEFEVYERKPAMPDPDAAVPQAPAGTPQPPASETGPVADPEPSPVAATDEFEVYERDAPAHDGNAEPMASSAAMQEPTDVTAPDPAYVAPPQSDFQEPAREPPTPEAPPRRPEVWPPIQSHRPPAETGSQAPAQPPARPRPEPPAQQTSAPTQTPRADPMATERSGPAIGHRIAIVQARFNIELTEMMAELAVQKATKLGADVVAHEQCPGVYDLPLPTKRLLARDDIDGVVVIGVVVQGETKHDEIITHATAKTLQELSLQYDKPVGLAITGPGMTWQQAEARVVNAAHGVEAVVALLAQRTDA